MTTIGGSHLSPHVLGWCLGERSQRPDPGASPLSGLGQGLGQEGWVLACAIWRAVTSSVARVSSIDDATCGVETSGGAELRSGYDGVYIYGG
jgi:hypothetical protein